MGKRELAGPEIATTIHLEITTTIKTNIIKGGAGNIGAVVNDMIANALDDGHKLGTLSMDLSYLNTPDTE